MQYMISKIELFLDGHWTPVAEIEAIGADLCRFEYLADYVFSDRPAPVAFNYPVELGSQTGRLPFLYDLVPQGAGRKFLLSVLDVRDADDLVLPLIQHGAFNPVGRMRLDTAVRFFQKNVSPTHQGDGFELEKIVARDPDFVEYLSLHGMLGCGSTGIQGAAPKFLLTQNKDGLWFADTLLPDDRADKHWLVKLPRGKDDSDRLILRTEAEYLNIAKECGLRVHEDCMIHNDMLFVRRFDRTVQNGKVMRLHQESLASVAGHRGFGIRANHFDLVAAFLPHVSDPATELAEYIKRDILNLALRNTDNHARNTALQILENGHVRLTPLFDFAPMFLDREMIARSSRWLDKEAREIRSLPNILEALPVTDQVRDTIASALRAFLPFVQKLPELLQGRADEQIREQCQYSIETQCNALAEV